MSKIENRVRETTKQLGNSPNIYKVLGNLLQIVPEIGCVQGCAHCSQFAPNRVARLDPTDMEILVRSIGAVYEQTGVKNSFNEIYPYKDNDPGQYPHLDLFAQMMSDHVGIPLRLSTQGISASRPDLLSMHERIVSDPKISAGIGRLRISFTPGIPAFNTSQGVKQYEYDIAQLLKIYRPWLDDHFVRSLGKGKTKEVAKFGVFLRYNPKVTKVPFKKESDGTFIIEKIPYYVAAETEEGLLTISSGGQVYLTP